MATSKAATADKTPFFAELEFEYQMNRGALLGEIWFGDGSRIAIFRSARGTTTSASPPIAALKYFSRKICYSGIKTGASFGVDIH